MKATVLQFSFNIDLQKIITKLLKIVEEDKKHLRFVKDWSAVEVT